MSQWSLAYLKEARRCIKKLSMLNLEKEIQKSRGPRFPAPISRLPNWNLENGAEKRGRYLMLGNRIKRNIFTEKKMSKWSLAYLKEARRCIKKPTWRKKCKNPGVPVFEIAQVESRKRGRKTGTFSPVFLPRFRDTPIPRRCCLWCYYYKAPAGNRQSFLFA